MLVGASGKKSAHQSLRTARLARLRGLGSGDDPVTIRTSRTFDTPVPAPSGPHFADLSIVATLVVISAFSALSASYFANSPSIKSFLSASNSAPSETERSIPSSLVESEEPSIKSKTTTTGSAAEPKAPTLFEKVIAPESNSTDPKMAGDYDNGTTADGKSAMEQPSLFEALAIYRSVDETLDAEDNQFSSETAKKASVATDMAAAQPASARAAAAGLGTQVPVDRPGFIFEDSDVRYLSRAELEKLPPEQLSIARHEILARKGRFFKDASLSAHFSRFSWYQPSVWRIHLNAIEQANVSLIRSIETSPRYLHAPEIAQKNQY